MDFAHRQLDPPQPHPATYRFRFADTVPLEEAQATLQLALLAIEGLFGEARVRLDVSYRLEVDFRSIVVDASTAAGSALVGVFASFVFKEFGRDAVTVGRASAGEVLR